MGTIQSSTGLISGIDTASLISQLIALDAKPLNLLKTRVTEAQNQQKAFLSLSAKLLAAKAAIAKLSKGSEFTSKTAASSNSEVLTATATEKTPLDTYSFTVKSMVTTHQMVSARGFASRTSTVGSGTLTFEVGGGSVSPETTLASLNGFEGIRRGVIRITDRSGASAQVDLRTAVTLDEVINAINTADGIKVQAKASGDGLILSDVTGLSSGSLTVEDVNGGYTAADLGIAGTSTTGQVVGGDIFGLSDSTALTHLNDGNGIRIAGMTDDLRFSLKDGRQVDVNLSGTLRFQTRLAELNDGRGVSPGTIKLTNRRGESATIDLSGAETLQDVADAINGSGLSISVASLAGSKISISDASGGTSSNLKIEDVSGTAAADLGIVKDVAESSFLGSSVYRIDTVGAVLRAINYATENNGAVTAALSSDGNGIVITDNTAGSGTSTVEALNGSKALQDLGLSGGFNTSGVANSRQLVAGLNTVLLSSLNGGSGVNTSSLQITRRVGTTDSTETIDVSQAQTLRDVLDAINSKLDTGGAAMFKAEVAAGQTGIVIRDIGGGRITGFAGATATDLKLAADSAGAGASGDLQLKYVSDNTLLSSLNQGRGITNGTFRVTSSTGASGTVTLSTAQTTVGDVLKKINALNIGVTAQINAEGDGIEIVDTAGGSSQLTITESQNGTTAADLGIAGTAAVGSTSINGSFARKVQITGSDTLDDVVTKINAASAGLRASVVNDGNSYRLILSSNSSGTKGRVSYSTGTLDLSLNALSKPRDATVVVGDLDSPGALVITSSTNSISNVVDGLNLELHGTSDTPVNLTVSQDVDTMVTDIKTFITTFNDALDNIDEVTKYDEETKTKGVLLGDGTILRIRERLYAGLQATVAGAGLNDLADIGLNIGDGARLSLDEDTFRAAMEEDPDGVKNLLTTTTTTNGKSVSVGLAARLKDELDAITNSTTGVIAEQRSSLQDRIDLYNGRAADMQELLDLKQTRLEAQFQAMETALAAMQSQQTAIESLASLVSSSKSS